MALIVLHNGTRKFIRPEAGAKLWYMLNGEEPVHNNWSKIVHSVREIYLNPYNAPQSYRDRYAYRLPDDSPVTKPMKPYIDPWAHRKDLA